MQHLFFIGNKRSGTTYLRRLLNEHSKIFIAHEADAVWIAFCRFKNQPLNSYPDDGPGGLTKTLNRFSARLADETLTGANLINAIILAWAQDQGGDPTNITLIGDKKPVQTADPVVFDFVRAILPKAKFLHLIRHPIAVVESMKSEGKRFPRLAAWQRRREELIDFWVRNELWVEEHKEAFPNEILTVRYQDLVSEPRETVSRLFTFLEIAAEDSVLDHAVQRTEVHANAKYSDVGDLPEAARELVARYGLTL